MKTFYLGWLSYSRLAVLSLFALCLNATAFAQNVNVSNAHPSSNGTYATLNDAFVAINSQVQTGNNINVQIVASTTETVSAVLNTGAWNSLRIFPNASGIVVAGNLTTPLIDLDGAANVTFDGRVNGASPGASYALTLRNSNTGIGASTATIRFINSANTDTIQYVRIEGSSTSNSAGTILFSTASSGSGNSDNVLQFNRITNASGNRPSRTLHSLGSASFENTANKIENNEFFDILRQAASSDGILIAGNNNDWLIKGNSFYETSTLSSSSAATYQMIYVSNTNVNGTQIIGNHIGGSAVNAGGTPLVKNNNNNIFYGIRLNVGSSSVTSVDSNFISNISWLNSSNAAWYGIAVDAGWCSIGATNGNVIGSATGTGNIYIEGGGTTSAMPVFGIRVNSANACVVSNNTIASITANRNNTDYAVNFQGISKSSSGTLVAENNTIGSLTQANSIWLQSPSTLSTSTLGHQDLYGFYNNGTGLVNLKDNIIANLNNATTNATEARLGLNHGIHFTSGSAVIEGNTIQNLTIANANSSGTTTSALAGMMLQGVAVKTVRGNTVSNINNTFSNFKGSIYGIYFVGNTGTDNGLYENFVHSLGTTNNNATDAASIFGIRQAGTQGRTIANNIVVLQSNQTNEIYGIYEDGASGTANVYHNTVYVGGSAASGSAPSYDFFSQAATPTQNFLNNIFVNERTGGSGTHYAIRLSGTASLNINNNVYRVSGGVTGFLGADQATLSDWQTATGQDGFSVNVDPQFALSGGTNAVDYIPSSLILSGNIFLGVNIDFTGSTRIYYSMGAYDVFTTPAVTVNASAGLATDNYFNIKEAFDKINDGTHQGVINVVVNGGHFVNTTALLNASGVGGSSYSSIRVFPSAENIAIEGNIAAPLIDLNGANNVTFDGRVNGVSIGAPYALTLRNTNVSNTAGNSTIRFINSASNDTVQYVRVEGSSAGTTSGVIFLSTSTAATGNNNNIIRHNKITNAGGNRAANSVFSSGTVAKFNTGNKFTNNEVFDFFHPSLSSNGVLIAGNNTSWTIRNNSFYETQSFTQTSTTTCHGIYLSSTDIVNSDISANCIGGSQAFAGGSAFTKTGSNNTFYGIRLNVGTSSLSTVDSNIISNMSWVNSGTAEWYGIQISTGLVDVGSNYGNTIGSATGTGSIYLEGGGTFGTSIYYGISITSANTTNVENNTIASITNTRTNTGYATHFYGIFKSGAGICNISDNTIGSASQANSIWSQSASSLNNTSSDQRIYGISSTGSGAITISGNTIANLNNATTNAFTSRTGFIHGISSSAGTNLIENNSIHNLSIANANNNNLNSASVAGMMLTGSTVKSVRQNTLFNLTNSFTDFEGSLYGIYFTGTTGTGNGLFRNYIHSIQVPNNTGAVAANIYGIRQFSVNVATFANNIVALNNDNTALVYGIFDNATGGTINLYQNTVYVGGSPATGSANSYALWANSSAGIQDYRNNIFSNERAGGSGTHYAIGLTGTTTLTINNNAYYAGMSGVLGFLGGDQNTLEDWQTATSQDGFSVNTDPDFDNAGGTNAVDYIPNASNIVGNLFLGIADDFTGAARTYFSMGAFDVPLDAVVTVNATAGVPTADYPNLTDAFTSINDGTHQGTIEVLINLGHTLSVSTVLNASGVGAANYTGVRIFPTDDDIVVSANIAGPMIDFDGADNVTFDGRVDGVSSGNPHALTLRNTNTSVSANNATIRLINGATNDTIQYVKIEGSSTATASGVIFLSTSTAPAGNNDNVFHFNLITNAVGNRAVNSLYSLGTAAKFNTGNKFENNEVFNFFNPGTTSTGVLIAGNNTDWTIRNNSFYETGTLAPTTTTTYTAIYLNSANIVNSVVSGNFIGGSQPLAGGTPFTKSGSNTTFLGIRLSVGTTTVTSVDSNFVTNMSWTNSSSAEWYGIRIDAGLVDVGSTHGNTIGAATGTGSIYLEAGSTTVIPSYYGISTASSSNLNIQNNIISSITTNRTNTGYGTQFYGIHRTGSAITNIENNMIGSSTQANSIWSQSISNLNASASTQIMYGIFNSGSGTMNVIGNTIANLSNASSNPNTGVAGFVQGIASSAGTTLIQTNDIHNLSISSANNLSTTSASLAGIMLSGSSVKSVRENNIYNLTNSFTDFVGHIYGIHFLGTTGTGNGAYRNFIHSLNAPNNTGTVAATIYGVRILSGGTAAIENNIISLDNDNTTLVYGIFDNATAGTANIYHNTVYVGGNPSNGSANSYGLWANAINGIKDYRNNILSNARDGGSGSHYAVGLPSTASLTINNNDYFVGATGVTGFLTTDQNTLADWQAATGQDDFSIDTDPDFDNAGGTNAIDYIPNATNIVGNLFLGVADDFTGSARTYFSMGAFDVPVDAVVTVNATAGVPTADYPNLTDAFTSINDGTHQGAIEVLIKLGHVINASAVLNASGIGAANYSEVRIFATDDNIVVSANIAGPMIDLDGADNVTFDGRVDGVSSGNPNALTLRNTNTSATANNATIRFINGASNDTIQYVRIEGSSTATASGVIFLSTSTATDGNNDNVIQHNLITNANGNRAINSLYSLGTAAKFNTGNKFENNEVLDFLRPQASSNGILIAANNTDWTIRSNSFYETGVFSPTTTTTYTIIHLNSANIVNSVVSGNYIGGTQAMAGGTAWTKTSNNTIFYGIRTSVGTSAATVIDSNVISNISWTNSSSANWYGISHEGGSASIGSTYGNVIGAATGTGSIYLEGGSTTVIPDYFGINITAASPSVVVANNNTIASITTNRGNTQYGTLFYGIYKSSTGTLTAENNTIGSASQSNSIWSQSASTNPTSSTAEQRIYGIYNVGSGEISLTNNLIANLTNGTTNTATARTGLVHGIASTGGVNLIENNSIHNLSIANANTTAANVSSVAGIMLTGTSRKTVLQNTIYNLSNTSTDFEGHLYGIYFTGTTGANNGAYRNFIYGIDVPNNTAAAIANVYGIRQVPNGVATIQNNIIELQGDNTANIFGLYDNGTTGTTNFHNNTVYISGEPTSGSASSYALFSNAVTAIQNFRNNILVNEREGGSGTHYSVRVAGTGTLTINQNLYRVSPSGVTGFLGSDQATLSDWQTATSQDQFSLDIDPQFVNTGTGVAADYLPQNTSAVGVEIATVTDDFAGSSRLYYAMGAWDYPVNYIWRGGGTGDPQAWNNALNWVPSHSIPLSSSPILFEDNGNGHNLVLDQNRSAMSINFNGSDKNVVLGSFNLTVSNGFSGANADNYVLTAGSGSLNVANLGDGQSFVMPVGNSEYNPVTITNNTGDADNFSARVLDVVLDNGLSGSAITEPHLGVTWDLGKTNANAGSGVDFMFTWNQSQEVGTIPEYILNHHDGASWEIAAGTTGTPSGSPIKTMTHTGYTGTFSPFAIGPSPTSALPVELLGIQVNCLNEGKNAEITWQTASELNSDKFIIERSVNGASWDVIAAVDAAGTTNQMSAYSFVDNQTRTSNVIYYRLTQVDFDGTSTTYPIVSSACDMTEEIVLFPNPAREHVYVQIVRAMDENIHVEVRNQLGAILSTRAYSLLEGMNLLNIDINNLSAGQYFIVVTSENKEPRMIKFIKGE